MKKHVVLLSSAAAAPTMELIESLSSSGIAVRIEGLHSELDEEEISPAAAEFPLADPIAILYEIAPDTATEELRAVIELANAKWPGVSIVASRRSSENPAPRDPALKQLGFRAVAERPAQLAALLRQVEEGSGTGEIKLPPEFKSSPHSRAFSLPASVRGEDLRGALTLLSSLHLASNQKEAGQSALAGIARLVAASRWAIFVTAQTGGVYALSFEPLVARSNSGGASLRFDEDWRRELLSDPEIPSEPESKSARTAATRNETIRKIERGRRVIAVPLVSGERVLGVLEGVRDGAGASAILKVVNGQYVNVAK